MANPVVTIKMADGGVIKAELYPEIAPNTVNNFISLVKQGYYDGVIFHRVIPGFMIQGGDPDGTGRGGVILAIKHKWNLPVRFIGIGETADDLKEFRLEDFASTVLKGIEKNA